MSAGLAALLIVLGIAFYMTAGFTLADRFDSAWYLFLWPFMLMFALTWGSIKYLAKAPKSYLEYRKKGRIHRENSQKPSYILASTIATMLIRYYDEIKSAPTRGPTRRPTSDYFTRSSLVFNKDEVSIRRDEERYQATYSSRGDNISVDWTFKIGGESYNFSENEKKIIEKAFEEALKLKELSNRNQIETDRQMKALDHIERFMGI